MNEPCTKSQFRAKKCDYSKGIFGHGLASREAQSVGGPEGVLGRLMADLTGGAKFKTALYSLSGNQRALRGDDRTKMDHLSSGGASRFDAYSDLKAGIDNFTAFESGSTIAEHFLDGFDASLRSTNLVGNNINKAQLESRWSGHGGVYANLRMVAKAIKSDIADRKSERAGFYVDSGSRWDTHSVTDIGGMLGTVDNSVGALAAELKAQGVWDNVTIVAISEFGRTLTGNARGTDHGWGGNYWVAGGAVRGARVLGTFPERVTEDDSDVTIGRGRVLPSTPFDAMWHGIAQWMGARDVSAVLPNSRRFPPEQLFSAADMFAS